MAVDYNALKTAIAELVGGTVGLPNNNDVKSARIAGIYVGSDSTLDRITPNGSVSGTGISRFRHEVRLAVLLIETANSPRDGEIAADTKLQTLLDTLESNSTGIAGATIMYPEAIDVLDAGDRKTARYVRVVLDITD